jgi:predicted ATP-dependent endonuclease of OLD family
MELLFIHINKPYSALEGKSFNLSSKYSIDYSSNRNELKIDKTKNYIPDFFGKNITNVTCVIGENGVGKTTFLRYVKELYFERRNEIDIRDGDVVAYIKEDVLFVHISANYDDFDINNLVKGLSVKTIKYKKKPKVFDYLKNELTIYFSNNFDLYDDFVESEILYNTSTPFLSRTSNARINKEFKTKKVNTENRFLLNEFQRNRKFLQSDKIKSINHLLKPVDFIEVIPVSKTDVNYKSLIRSIHRSFPDLNKTNEPAKRQKEDLIDLVNQVSNAFLQRKKEVISEPKRQLFDLQLTEIIVYEVLVKLLKSSSSIKDVTIFKLQFQNLTETNKLRGNLSYFLRKMPELFFQLLSGFKEKQKELFKYFKDLEALVDLLIYQDDLWQAYPDRATVKTNSPLLDKIIESYFQLPFSTNSLKLDWSRLSAGEESMITFFSRIDGAIRLKSKKRNNILILIDEGDLYFHPEWQRQYLNAIFDFLKQYKEINFQIILTSHSPFILSDLPQNNVITFQKTKEGIEVSKNMLSKTFGGNIHELLIDKFFLKDGIIGVFADNKIMELIKRVNNNKTTAQDGFLVNEIGDKFLAATIRTNLEE